MPSPSRPPTRKWMRDVYSPTSLSSQRLKGVASQRFHISSLRSISEEAQFPAPILKTVMGSGHVAPRSPGLPAVFLAESGRRTPMPVSPQAPSLTVVMGSRLGYATPLSPGLPALFLAESWRGRPMVSPTRSITVLRHRSGRELAEATVSSKPVSHTVSIRAPHLWSTFRKPTYSVFACTNPRSGASVSGLSESLGPAPASPQDLTDALEQNEGADALGGSELAMPTFGPDTEVPWQRSGPRRADDRKPMESPPLTGRSVMSTASYGSYVLQSDSSGETRL